MAITNFAGQIYNKFDSILKELKTTNSEGNNPKKFSGGGLLTRNMGSTFGGEDVAGMDMKESQLIIPIRAMQEIRKRRIKKNGIS